MITERWDKQHDTKKRNAPGIWQYKDIVLGSLSGADLVVRSASWVAGWQNQMLKVFDREKNHVEKFRVKYIDRNNGKEIVFVDELENNLPISIISNNCDILEKRKKSAELTVLLEEDVELLDHFYKHLIEWDYPNLRLLSIATYDSSQQPNPFIPIRNIRYYYSESGALINTEESYP